MTPSTHIWVPFRDTALFVEFGECGECAEFGEFTNGADDTDRTPGQREPLAGIVPPAAVARDDRYGAPLWRVDAEHLHTVVEALWSTDHPLHIHLDQAPRQSRDGRGSGERDG
jgi:hypothetical protein